MEFAKRITKDTSRVRTVNINRITGAVQSIQRAHGKYGKAFSVLEFNGNCTKQSSKF